MLEPFYRAFINGHLCYGNIDGNVLFETKCIKERKLIEATKFKDGWNCKRLYDKYLVSFEQGVMIYKVLQGLCPKTFRKKFVARVMISDYRTRNHNDLQVLVVLECAQRNF